MRFDLLKCHLSKARLFPVRICLKNRNTFDWKEPLMELYKILLYRFLKHDELHVLQSLLPRDLFETHPEYFRMDTEGKRSQKYNICFTSEGAYRVIERELKKVTEWLKPTTGRYFFWTDDVTDGFCHCPECEEYSASEQSLIYENRLLKMLRDQFGPKVTLAHLAYNQTLPPPIKVKPIEGIFLEYAPIGRDYSKPLSEKHQASLEENLKRD